MSIRIARGLIANMMLIGLLIVGVGLDVSGLQFPVVQW